MSKMLNYQTISELAPLIKKKELSPVEVTEAVLKQTQDLDKKLNAFIDISSDNALEAAKKAEEDIVNGQYRGALHGIPMALKDLFNVKGEKTTFGSKIHKDFISDEDATVVSKLRNAGVVFTGKLNLHEYALGATTTNPHFGACHNPWDLERIPGGSSGGSGAAVAAHMTIASLGTDTGGSIRIPSSSCGIFGLKPTHGRVSKFGCFPVSWSLDHIGPMTKTVTDAALVLEAIAGYDPKDPTCSSNPTESYLSKLNGNIKGLRIGVMENYFFKNLDARVEQSVRNALKDLEKEGAKIIEVDIPAMIHSEYALMATLFSEASAVHHDNLLIRQEDFGDDVRFLLKFGELPSAVDYVRAQQIRYQLDNEFKKVFQNVDVLISPTIPYLPPKIGQSVLNVNGEDINVLDHFMRFTGPFDLTGLPAASIPCGYADGLPIGLQIVGPAFGESTVLNTAYAFEQTHLDLKKNPPILESLSIKE